MEISKYIYSSLFIGVLFCLEPLALHAKSKDELRDEIASMSAEKIKQSIITICPQHPSGNRMIKRKSKSRLSSFKPNYLIAQRSDGDEDSLKAHYSFRYLFTDPDCMS